MSSEPAFWMKTVAISSTNLLFVDLCVCFFGAYVASEYWMDFFLILRSADLVVYLWKTDDVFS